MLYMGPGLRQPRPGLCLPLTRTAGSAGRIPRVNTVHEVPFEELVSSPDSIFVGRVRTLAVGEPIQLYPAPGRPPRARPKPRRTVLGNDAQDALRTCYGTWMDDSTRSRLRRIAYGGSLDAIERVKSGFAANLPRDLAEAGGDFWQRFAPDFEKTVADDDLAQILAVATDCDERELINQVGLKPEVGKTF